MNPMAFHADEVLVAARRGSLSSHQFYGARLSSILTNFGDTVWAAGYS